jgi:hypothetical protein
MNRFLSTGLACFTAATLAMTCGCASSATASSTDKDHPPVAAVKPVKDPVALAELKKMGEALAAAKTMHFSATTMTPIRGANNQWVHVFSTAKVSMKRPNKLMIETGGDAFPEKIFFDGTTFSASATEKKLYSQTPMTGTVDSALAQAASKAGEVFAFSDVLIADPLTSWSNDLEGAVYIGESNRGGEKLKHFALTAKDVDWEVWTDEKTHLPRVVYVKYTGENRTPTILIEFSHWKLDATTADADFNFKAPAGFKKIELKTPEGATK